MEIMKYLSLMATEIFFFLIFHLIQAPFKNEKVIISFRKALKTMIW